VDAAVTAPVATLEERLAAAEVVQVVRAALAGRDDVWVVGGAVRDALLGSARIADLDLAVAHDAEGAARAIDRAVVETTGGAALFPLSDEFGAWRVIAPGWRCDITPLQGATLADDLRGRDFTINAMAVPLAGGELIDPHGGAADLAARTLRMVADDAYARDRLRPLRLARFATELGFEPDAQTAKATREWAPAVADVAGERVFAELRRIVLAPRVLEGLRLSEDLGVLRAVLPELTALHGVEQSHFHHLDVYEHTLEVLRSLLDVEQRLDEVFPGNGDALRTVLDQPLADELTRGEALRFAALFHDIGKLPTRAMTPSGRVTFIGHDRVGAEMIGAICRRLRTSERLREYLAALTRHHLVLGFLVHERPLSRRQVYQYLKHCSPVEVEVTVLTCADRLATRGRNADAAIEAHLELARELTSAALEWRAHPPQVPVRGDELAARLGMKPGPELGRLLGELEEAVYAGDVTSADQAVEYARALRDNPGA
jgi:poly(A) polymerase